MNPVARVLTDAAASRLFRPVEVIDVEDLAPDFRIVRFAGVSLRGVSWVPGHKLQIRLEGFTTRTYTPVTWDPDRGETSILAFLHGTGPGSEMLRALTVGQHCQFFGPRGSIDLTKVPGEPLIVGDETSFGLTAAWANGIGTPARFAFEAQDPTRSRQVLETIGVNEPEIVDAPATHDAPGRDDSLGLEGAVDAAITGSPAAHLVLTGRAQTIRRIRVRLKQAGNHTDRVTVKAYWDENRSGLD